MCTESWNLLIFDRRAVIRKAASGSCITFFLSLSLVLPLSTCLGTTALWGEPTQTNMWELSHGKIQVTPRATELGLDPPAATPAGKEVTGNTEVMLNQLFLLRDSHIGLLVWERRSWSPYEANQKHIMVYAEWQLSVYSFTLQQTEGPRVQCR